jgi:TonB family protein
MKKTILLFLACFYPLFCLFAQENTDLILDFNSKKSLYGFKNSKNKLVIKYQYSYAEPFQEGFAVVENKLKFGYIDKNGDFFISPNYADAGLFSEGLAYFSYDTKHYGYIDKTGNVVIEPKFDRALDFKNGYATVLKNNPDTSKFGKMGYIEGLIDKSGKLIGNQWFTSVGTQKDSINYVWIKEKNYKLNLKDGQLTEYKSMDSNSDTIKFIVEVMPEFPGGDLALRKYIAENVRYPISARIHNIMGKTYTRFAVSETGEVTNVSIARGVHPLIDKESVRIIKTLPRWKPGMQKGKAVNVWYTVPINFRLD